MECPICLSNPPNTALDCAHNLCSDCYAKVAPGTHGNWSTLPICPLCRTPHLAAHPGLAADVAASLIGSIKSIKLPESTVVELGKASGAYLHHVLDRTKDIKRQLDDAIDTLIVHNSGAAPAAGSAMIPPGEHFLQHVATMTIVARPTFAQLFGTPVIDGAYWSGSGGFRFQYLASAPQVVNSAIITDNVLRRTDAFIHLNDGMLALYRFGLLPPAASDAIRRGESVPLPVLQVALLLTWYITKAYDSEYTNPFMTLATTDEVFQFYQDTTNNHIWYQDASADNRVWLEIGTLYAWCWVRRLHALHATRGESREAHTVYYTAFNTFYLNNRHTSQFEEIVAGHFPNLARAKKCAGCHNMAPLNAFYSARRGNEPRRVRCEGCMPRHANLTHWGE